MYYHCRPLKYVEYGKILPPSEEIIDDDFIYCYRWLGNYCGYCPQIWLSRSRSCLTGYKSGNSKKEDFVMFGFDVVKGFPLEFDTWELFIYSIMSLYNKNKKPSLNQINSKIFKDIQDFIKEDDEGYMDKYKYKSFQEILDKVLFMEHDQVVVPSLNLKSAKEIFVRTEKTKKKLKKMGFIDDRIKIMPNKMSSY